MIRIRMRGGWQIASLACLAAVAACSSDDSRGTTGAGSGSATGGSSGSAGGGSSGSSSGAAGGDTGAASSSSGAGAMDGSGSGTTMGDDGGMSSGDASAGDDGGTGTDSSADTGAMGQFTITFDASAPNHFGPEHAGLTAYAELVDTTGGMKQRVGDIYSSLMTTTGYAKWVWPNVGVAGHTYTFAIFDDAAPMNPTCKNGMPPDGDAGWTFPLNDGMPITGDSTFIFPTNQAVRDPNKCDWFPMGPIMGAVPVPTP